MKVAIAVRRQGIVFLAGLGLTMWIRGTSAGPVYDLGGVMAWNLKTWESVSLGDYYGPNFEIAKLKPIEIVGCRNGVFSGHMLVSWTIAPIEGLHAKMSELKSKDGKVIPLTQIQVRYAHPANARTGWTPPHRFNLLLPEPPDPVEIVNVTARRGFTPKHAGPVAMIPVWVTVRVTKDVAAGDYEGTLSIDTDNNKLPPLPVKLSVADYTLPDPVDFRIQTVALQSQESVALSYNVPLWSDEHFKLMEPSLKLLAELNSRQLAMNLCLDFYGQSGNSESMVRWIKQADGTYTHDFTPFDKYLELAERAIGRPNMLRLNCWGEWGGKRGAEAKDSTQKASWGQSPSQVSLLDPETGKLSRLDLPPGASREFVEFWKPVFTQALAKLETRGWLDVTAIGHNSYCWSPVATMVDAAHELWPAGVWAYTAHNGGLGGKFKGSKGMEMLVLYPEHIWGPGPGSKMGGRGYKTLLQPRPGFIFHTMRNVFWDYSELPVLLSTVERNIASGHDGVSDFGGDFFPCENPNSPGRFYYLGNGRGTGGPHCSTLALIGRGPNGAVETERFEAFRHGLQLCETILFVQQGIDSAKLPTDLATEADTVLQTRVSHMSKSHVLKDKSGKQVFSPSLFAEGCLERDKALFDVAARIASHLGPDFKHPRVQLTGKHAR